jgi:hypothetical protein
VFERGARVDEPCGKGVWALGKTGQLLRFVDVLGANLDGIWGEANYGLTHSVRNRVRAGKSRKIRNSGRDVDSRGQSSGKISLEPLATYGSTKPYPSSDNPKFTRVRDINSYRTRWRSSAKLSYRPDGFQAEENGEYLQARASARVSTNDKPTLSLAIRPKTPRSRPTFYQRPSSKSSCSPENTNPKMFLFYPSGPRRTRYHLQPY